MKKYILAFLFFFYYFLSFGSGFSNINFHTGKSELVDSSKEELDKVFVYLTDSPFAYLEIEGHTDSYECKDSLEAIRLGWERAYNTQQYLVDKGIKKCRIPIYSYGKEQPTVPNEIDGKISAANKAINRRVEFLPTYRNYKLYISKKVDSYDSLIEYTIKFSKEYNFLKNSKLVVFGETGRNNEKNFDIYMARMGRHLAVIELSEEDNYMFKDILLLDKLAKQNAYLGLDYAYFIEEHQIDETFSFYVCVLEWKCEE